VHHRVKNNLQIVASRLNMQAGGTHDQAVTRALADASIRISTIALIHSQLSEGPNPQSVDMRVFIGDLVRNIQRTFAGSTAPVDIVPTLDALSLPAHLASPCGLLISELVTNAYQHAFTQARAGRIDIRLVAREGTVTVAVRDNGSGLPQKAEGHDVNGLGLRLVRLLATKQLRGEISFARGAGTEVTVRFPLGHGRLPGDGPTGDGDG